MSYTLDTFDLSFDETFRHLIPNLPPITADPCHLKGIYVTWEGLTGWVYYLFSGNSDEDFASASLGQFQQAGLSRDTRREGGTVLTIRAGGLSKSDAAVIKTIFIARVVYALAKDSGGVIQAAPVRVEPGTNPVWRDSQGTISMEARLVFPTIKGFRA